MSLAFVIVAVIFFLFAAWRPQPTPWLHLGWLGMAFWAASVLVGR